MRYCEYMIGIDKSNYGAKRAV